MKFAIGLIITTVCISFLVCSIMVVGRLTRRSIDELKELRALEIQKIDYISTQCRESGGRVWVWGNLKGVDCDKR